MSCVANSSYFMHFLKQKKSSRKDTFVINYSSWLEALFSTSKMRIKCFDPKVNFLIIVYQEFASCVTFFFGQTDFNWLLHST